MTIANRQMEAEALPGATPFVGRIDSAIDALRLAVAAR